MRLTLHRWTTIALLSLALVGLRPAAPAEAQQFTEGFELGDFASFWSEVVSSISINIDPRFVHSGNFSARITYTRNEERGHTFLYNFSTDHVYIRWYEYFEQGFDFPYQLKMSNWGAEGDFWAMLQLSGQRKSNGDYGIMGTSFTWGDDGPNSGADDLYGGTRPAANIVTGRWYCFELEYRLNTPGQRNGVARLWIDGQVIGSHTDVSIRGSSSSVFSSMWTGGNYSNSVAGSNPVPNPETTSRRYMDDIVIRLDGVRVGCMGSIPNPPPNAPTNLRVR